MNANMKEHSLELASVIKDQIEQITSYEQQAPQIEIDIVKENIRQLYETVSSFRIVSKPTVDAVQVEAIDEEINNLLNEAEQMFVEETEKQIKEQETVLEEQAEEDKIEPEIPDEETITKVHEEVENEVKAEVEVENEEEVKVEDKPGPKAKNESELKVKIEPKEPKAPLGEKKVYVLDVEAEEEEEDEEFKNPSINLKPIKSLKTGIGINDKFMFISDLYEGNAKLYNKIVKKLDAMPSLQDALYLLGDLKDENFWESTDNAFRQFKIYIERRFL